MNIFDFRNMSQLDKFLFVYIPGIVIILISLFLALHFSVWQGILLFTILSVAYLSIQFLLQGMLLFLPSERKKFKEDLKRQQSKDSQSKEKDTTSPSFSLCLKYPDHEEEIVKKIEDFLLANVNAKNKILAMVITAAEDAGIIKPKFNRTVVAKKFSIRPNELSRYLNGNWEKEDEKSIEDYQEEFLKMKDVFDAAEKSKKTK